MSETNAPYMFADKLISSLPHCPSFVTTRTPTTYSARVAPSRLVGAKSSPLVSPGARRPGWAHVQRTSIDRSVNDSKICIEAHANRYATLCWEPPGRRGKVANFFSDTSWHRPLHPRRIHTYRSRPCVVRDCAFVFASRQIKVYPN